MDYLAISKMDTTLSAEYVTKGVAGGCVGFHESLLRAYHILNKVKELLSLGVPGSVVLDLIALMESDQSQKERAS